MPNDNDGSSSSSSKSFVNPDPITPEEITAAVKAAHDQEVLEAQERHTAEIQALRDELNAMALEERNAEMRGFREQLLALISADIAIPDLPTSSATSTAKAPPSTGGGGGQALRCLCHQDCSLCFHQHSSNS